MDAAGELRPPRAFRYLQTAVVILVALMVFAKPVTQNSIRLPAVTLAHHHHHRRRGTEVTLIVDAVSEGPATSARWP